MARRTTPDSSDNRPRKPTTAGGPGRSTPARTGFRRGPTAVTSGSSSPGDDSAARENLKGASGHSQKSLSFGGGHQLLGQRPLDNIAAEARLPRVRLSSPRRHPAVFRKMIAEIDSSARPGDVVAVLDPDGQHMGFGLFNPRAEIVVRMIRTGSVPPNEQFWNGLCDQAVSLRLDWLKLDAAADAYRVIHADSDGFPGLVVDRYGDTLSAEAFSLAMWQRSQAVVSRLAKRLGTSHWFVQAPPQTHGQEGFQATAESSPDCPQEITINEFGTRFSVQISEGHKTGFFCDQRENRRRVAEFCAGKRVLDLCCYTGGFSVQAARLGNASEVVGVDLDEAAIRVARQNAKQNNVNVKFVQADAFGYLRDLIAAGKRYDVVIVDPPKLIHNRRDIEVGTKAHLDLNRLAFQVVEPGGLMVTCTCSGLLGHAEFRDLVFLAARQAGPRPVSAETKAATATAESQPETAVSKPIKGPVSSDPGSTGPVAGPVSSGRIVQLVMQTGAAADHPVSGTVPETEYLQAMFLRVW